MQRRVGEYYKDFRFTKIEPIEEINCALILLTHEPTGATIMQIQNDDQENLFSLLFSTYPSSSNGAPHVLEHTVLCGSKRFPVKDSFFSMQRRSLSTYMNALTGSDFTCYPASSQVEKDFYNLLDVYLDAAFHPLLKKESFLQEGCRLEFSELENPLSPLTFKGIVFNEMKGNLGSAEARLWQALFENLLPDLPYAFNAGGDPKEIPNLTYDEFKQFHQTYYHPSHCLFYFYGNIPVEKHLDFISEKIPLKNYKKAKPLLPLPIQKRFQKPLQRTLFYPTYEVDLKKKTFMGFGWLTTKLLDQDEILALTLLDAVLMDTDASLLRHKLITSNLCIQADSYLDVEIIEIPYFIICKGCEKEDAEKLKTFLFQSLSEIAEKGIDKHLIDASLHQLQLNRLEIIGSSGGPYGLTLFMRSALAKQHGADPADALKIQSQFNRLLKAAESPDFLPRLIRKYLLNNPHFVEIIMSPDPELEKREFQEETQRLAQIASKLTEKEKKNIIKEAKNLKEYQIQTENQSLDCLPFISSSEIPKEVKHYPLSEEKTHFFHHDAFTNGLIYADFILDLSHLEESDLPYAQLFTSLLPQLGMGDRDYMANLDFTYRYTGGIGSYLQLYPQIENPDIAKPAFIWHGKSLLKNADHLLALMRDFFLKPNLEETKRISELLIQMSIKFQNNLHQKALNYAIQLALAGHSKNAYVSYTWNGLKYYNFIQNLIKDLDKNIPHLIEKLKNIKEQLFHLRSPHFALCCPKDVAQKLQEKVSLDFPSKDFIPWKGAYQIEPLISQARPISSQVAFTALGFKTVSYLHPDAPSIYIASHLFDILVLHKKIREQGGAYGGGSNYNPVTGNFYFYSYRDPHIASTVNAFHEAMDSIGMGHFTDQDIEEAKLEIIQALDTPISPGSRAMSTYNHLREGKTKEKRQAFREKLLACKKEDIKRAIENSLLPHSQKGTLVTFANKELIVKENEFLAKKGSALPIIPIN